jgi:hypothetical protein
VRGVTKIAIAEAAREVARAEVDEGVSELAEGSAELGAAMMMEEGPSA